MKILTGRYAGRTGRPLQYANDWISADLDDGTPTILKPHMVQLDEPDRALFADQSRHVGFFWEVWRLNEDGTFTSLLTQPERVRRRTGRRRRPSPAAR